MQAPNAYASPGGVKRGLTPARGRKWLGIIDLRPCVSLVSLIRTEIIDELKT